MSLKAGRVGVNPKEVDGNGNLKEASNSYSKAESDEKFETQVNIGGLQFRVESGTAQYKIPEGDWVNFNSGSGGVGFNIPDDATPITADMIQQGAGWYDILEGRYFKDENNILYVDMTIKCNNNFSSDSYLYLPVNEQPNYLSIVSSNMASVCISGSGKLSECYIGMPNNTKAMLRFNGGVSGSTFRMYGQMQLQA